MADVLRSLSFVCLGLLAAWPFYRLARYQIDLYYHEPGVELDELTFHKRGIAYAIGLILSFALSIAGLTFAVCYSSKLLVLLSPPADVELPGCFIGGYVGTIGLWVLMLRNRQHRFLRRVTDSLLRCNHCGYSLRGAEPVDGCIRCPECNQERSADELADEAEHLHRFAENESKSLLP